MVSQSSFTIRIPITKRDATKGIVYGWAALSNDADGVPIVDSDNEYIPIEELEKAAHDLFKRRSGAGMGGAMHDTMRVADLVASLPLSADTRKAFGFGEGVQGWPVGFEITDPATHTRVFSGEWSELSIRGMAERVEVEKLAGTSKTPRRYKELRNLRLSDIEAVSFVDRGASGNAANRPSIVLAKRDSTMAEPAKKTDPTTTPVKKEVTGMQVIAELLESGKLSDLDEAKKAALLALIGGAPKPPAPDEPAMPPGMPEEVKEAMKRERELAKSEREALAKKNADLEEKVAKMQAKVEHGELVEVVKRDFSHIPSPGLDVDQLADLLGTVRRELGADDAKAVEGVLKACSDLIRKGALAPQGSGAARDTTLGAYAILKREADEIRKSAGNKLSVNAALIEAGKRNPSLWADYQREQRAH